MTFPSRWRAVLPFSVLAGRVHQPVPISKEKMTSKTDRKHNSQVQNNYPYEELELQGKEESLIIPTVPADPHNLHGKVEYILDENLITLKKVHGILMNCVNLTKKQKLEFAESERYFMKQYLKKLSEKLKK